MTDCLTVWKEGELLLIFLLHVVIVLEASLLASIPQSLPCKFLQILIVPGKVLDNSFFFFFIVLCFLNIFWTVSSSVAKASLKVVILLPL